MFILPSSKRLDVPQANEKQKQVKQPENRLDAGERWRWRAVTEPRRET
jgi:hypothetical protein